MAAIINASGNYGRATGDHAVASIVLDLFLKILQDTNLEIGFLCLQKDRKTNIMGGTDRTPFYRKTSKDSHNLAQIFCSCHSPKIQSHDLDRETFYQLN